MDRLPSTIIHVAAGRVLAQEEYRQLYMLSREVRSRPSKFAGYPEFFQWLERIHLSGETRTQRLS